MLKIKKRRIGLIGIQRPVRLRDDMDIGNSLKPFLDPLPSRSGCSASRNLAVRLAHVRRIQISVSGVDVTP